MFFYLNIGDGDAFLFKRSQTYNNQQILTAKKQKNLRRKGLFGLLYFTYRWRITYYCGNICIS